MMVKKSLKYSFKSADQVTSAMFVLVDTVSIRDDKNEAAAMKELLENELVAAGDDDWKIVIGHFPCHSGWKFSSYGTFSCHSGTVAKCQCLNTDRSAISVTYSLPIRRRIQWHCKHPGPD